MSPALHELEQAVHPGQIIIESMNQLEREPVCVPEYPFVFPLPFQGHLAQFLSA